MSTCRYGVNDHYTGDVKQQHETRDGGVVKGKSVYIYTDNMFYQIW